MKLEFNKDNPNFIHISVDKCWKDDFLTEFFRPYIGDPEVKINDKIGELVPASMLAIADSTIQECKKLCNCLKVEEIPCQQWFLRNGKFADRKVGNWECACLLYALQKSHNVHDPSTEDIDAGVQLRVTAGTELNAII